MRRPSRNDATFPRKLRVPDLVLAMLRHRALRSIIVVLAPPSVARPTSRGEKSVEPVLLIASGTEVGCAAAVRAARMGVRSIPLVNNIANGWAVNSRPRLWPPSMKTAGRRATVTECPFHRPDSSRKSSIASKRSI